MEIKRRTRRTKVEQKKNKKKKKRGFKERDFEKGISSQHFSPKQELIQSFQEAFNPSSPTPQVHFQVSIHLEKIQKRSSSLE